MFRIIRFFQSLFNNVKKLLIGENQNQKHTTKSLEIELLQNKIEYNNQHELIDNNNKIVPKKNNPQFKKTKHQPLLFIFKTFCKSFPYIMKKVNEIVQNSSYILHQVWKETVAFPRKCLLAGISQETREFVFETLLESNDKSEIQMYLFMFDLSLWGLVPFASVFVFRTTYIWNLIYYIFNQFHNHNCNNNKSPLYVPLKIHNYPIRNTYLLQ